MGRKEWGWGRGGGLNDGRSLHRRKSSLLLMMEIILI